jgi:UDP-glucose 4-epimerase
MRTSTALTRTPTGAGVVAIFCANLAAQRISTIDGTGEQTRHYVYVGDVAYANVLAVERAPTSGAYNIANTVETSANELAGYCKTY